MMRTLIVLLSGCSLSTFVRPQAASDLGCPEKMLQMVESEDGGAVTVRGCGREAVYLRSAVKSPIQRATYDLSCSVERLKMTYLGDSSIGVEGCGKKVTYTMVDGSWVGNAAP